METANNTACNLRIEWKICNISNHKQELLHRVSPPFFFLYSSWQLQICIYNSENPKIEIALNVLDTSSTSTINFTFGIKDTPVIKYGPRTVTFGPDQPLWIGHNNANYVKKLIKKYIQEDTLTVYFEASTNESFVSTAKDKDVGSKCSSINDTALNHDFQGLLLSGKDSDVTIEVQGQTFKAHKEILKSRSPIFAAMFEHDGKEKNRGIIKENDCDPGTFRNFLQCTYTGKVDKLMSDNAISLHRMAVKYEMPDMKEQCVNLMKEEMTADTACDVILLADMSNDKQLKNYALEFIVSNMKAVLNTTKWKQFKAENGVLAATILETAFKKATNVMEDEFSVDISYDVTLPDTRKSSIKLVIVP